MLSIHLDEQDCFAAWVSAKEVGIEGTGEGADPKCKLKYSIYIVLDIVYS